jgi:hypothetical protein
MKRLLMALALVATPASSEEGPWAPMSGPEITQALTDRTLQYENAWQDFRPSGRTLYNAGRDSWGYWAVRDDQYCSLWPPSDLWACYTMTQRGDALRFIGEAGDITEATYRD